MDNEFNAKDFLTLLKEVETLEDRINAEDMEYSTVAWTVQKIFVLDKDSKSAAEERSKVLPVSEKDISHYKEKVDELVKYVQEHRPVLKLDITQYTSGYSVRVICPILEDCIYEVDSRAKRTMELIKILRIIAEENYHKKCYINAEKVTDYLKKTRLFGQEVRDEKCPINEIHDRCKELSPKSIEITRNNGKLFISKKIIPSGHTNEVLDGFEFGRAIEYLNLFKVYTNVDIKVDYKRYKPISY